MQRNENSSERTTVFVGIDVHKNSWTVAIIPPVGFTKQFTQAPSAEALASHLKRNYPGVEYLAVYESGFTGFSTYYELENLGIKCSVVNAADVPTTQKEEVSKTDRVDAKKLARSLKAGMIKSIFIQKKSDLDARSVVRLCWVFRRDISGYKTRIKQLLNSNGVKMPQRFAQKGTYWSRAFIKWLEEVRLLSEDRMSLDLIISAVLSLRGHMCEATKHIRELSKRERYSRECDLLLSIPGIGLRTAMAVLTEVGDIKRFKNERQFASYIGFIPTSHSSGDKISHGELTYRGNDMLKRMLIEASWVAVSRDSRLGLAYVKYKKRMVPQMAIVRIARKLSNIIFAVLKNGEKYNPQQ